MQSHRDRIEGFVGHLDKLATVEIFLTNETPGASQELL